MPRRGLWSVRDGIAKQFTVVALGLGNQTQLAADIHELANYEAGTCRPLP